MGKTSALSGLGRLCQCTGLDDLMRVASGSMFMAGKKLEGCMPKKAEEPTAAA